MNVQSAIATLEPKSERQLEDLLYHNFHDVWKSPTSLPGQWIPFRQVRVNNGIIDLLAELLPLKRSLRWAPPELYVIELKHGKAGASVIEQTRRYVQDVKNIAFGIAGKKYGWDSRETGDLYDLLFTPSPLVRGAIIAREFTFDIAAHEDILFVQWDWNNGQLILQSVWGNVLRRPLPPSSELILSRFVRHAVHSIVNVPKKA